MCTTSIQWGGMGALGLETEEHKLGAKFLYTLVSETQAIRLIDTRGAEYFRPGYDPSNPASCRPSGIVISMQAPALRRIPV